MTHPRLAGVRLHGRNAQTWAEKGLTASSQRFNYEYSDDEIAELAQRVDGLVERALQVHALLNVNYEDQGVRAARRLSQELRRLQAPDRSQTGPMPAEQRGQDQSDSSRWKNER